MILEQNFMVDGPVKKDQVVDFANISGRDYWNDLNGDGRMIRDEMLAVPYGADFGKTAAEWIQSHPQFYPAGKTYVPRVIDKDVYFLHPQKTLLKMTLEAEIRDLQRYLEHPVKPYRSFSMTDREYRELEKQHEPLPIFEDLLADLKMMLEELQYTRFRTAEPGDLPAGFSAQYDPYTSTMVVAPGAPISLLVHEMDHAVMFHQRVQNSHRLDHLPLAETERRPLLPHRGARYSFVLDYPENARKSLVYDDLDYFAINTNTGNPTEKSKRAALAIETHAYQTMSRYLLWKMRYNLSNAEIRAIARSESNSQAVSQSLKNELKKINEETGFSKLLLAYFGVTQSLDDFVLDWYCEKGASEFVDCKKSGG